MKNSDFLEFCEIFDIENYQRKSVSRLGHGIENESSLSNRKTDANYKNIIIHNQTP